MHKKTVLVASLALCLAVMSGCTHFDPSWSKAGRAIRHSYVFDNAPSSGIVQVYTVNSNTAIQIRGLRSKTVSFRSLDGKDIPYELVGDTALLGGVYVRFIIVTPDATSQVTDNTSPAAAGQAASTSASETAVAEPEDATALGEEAVRDEFHSLHTQLLRLKQHLVAVESFEPASTVHHAIHPENTDIPCTAQKADGITDSATGQDCGQSSGEDPGPR